MALLSWGMQFIMIYIRKKIFTDGVSVNKKYLTDSGVPIEKNTRFIIGGLL